MTNAESPPRPELPPAAGGSWRRLLGPAFDPLWVGLLLLAAYLANGDRLTSGDTLPSSCLPVSLLRDGDFSFTPEEAPFMFRWSLVKGKEMRPAAVRGWDQVVEGRRADELLAEGKLKLNLPHYFLTESAREGRYLGIYGPGPGLAALPLYAPFVGLIEDLPRSLGAVLWLGKISAALMCAASGVFLFAAAAGRMKRTTAWCVALAYGLGTCVWSQSSQALWQQTPVLLFFSAAVWALLREPATPLVALLSGAALGAAVVCRSTSAILLVAAAWFWARRGGKWPAYFGLGVLPSVAVAAAYSLCYLETPSDFVHADAHAGFALSKTGSMDLWQTPIWEGAAGILLSPGRGLFVYSPFLLLSAWGAAAAWKDPAYRALRPLGLALAGTLLLYSRWFDWWGGHSFGYRLIVDTVPLFVALAFPVAERILARPALRRTAAALALWSVAVQALGAFAYDQGGWNARVSGVEVRLPGRAKPVVTATRAEAEALAAEGGGKVLGDHELDVDREEHRHRLWSVRDNPIAYYALHFSESRRSKRARLRDFLEMR